MQNIQDYKIIVQNILPDSFCEFNEATSSFTIRTSENKILGKSYRNENIAWCWALVNIYYIMKRKMEI